MLILADGVQTTTATAAVAAAPSQRAAVPSCPRRLAPSQPSWNGKHRLDYLNVVRGRAIFARGNPERGVRDSEIMS